MPDSGAVTLIRHADDYGSAPSVSEAILELHQIGHLNSFSVLVNARDSTRSMEKLREISTYRPSLHFNLSEGQSLSRSRLLQDSEQLSWNFPALWRLNLSLGGRARKEFIQAVADELYAQLEEWSRFFSPDSAVSIDSHEHIHYLPIVFEAFCRAQERSGMVFHLRFAPEVAVFWEDAASLKKMLRAAILNHYHRHLLSQLPNQILPRSDVLLHIAPNPKALEKALKWLKDHPRPRAEWVLHPGQAKEAEDFLSGWTSRLRRAYTSEGRQQEYDFLLSCPRDPL